MFQLKRIEIIKEQNISSKFMKRTNKKTGALFINLIKVLHPFIHNALNKCLRHVLIFLSKRVAYNRGGRFLKNSISAKNFIFLSD